MFSIVPVKSNPGEADLTCDHAEAPYPKINANPNGGVELVCNACDLYMKLMKYGRYYDT